MGRTGERKAVKYLEKLGYRIREKNYKTFVGEIDIICEDNGVLVFVEVKTRTDDSFGIPAEAVTKQKIEKYGKVATEYLVKNKKTESLCRFDVIEIEDGKINHIKDAFSM